MLLTLIVRPSLFSAVPDTIKICALRVQFQPDDNPLTTGNGTFMIDTVTTDPFAIDPAPHNKQYFEDQILAAANYFYAVSKGRLIITGDVFPAEPNGAFVLPKTMGAYNPNTTEEAINKGISQLFVDAVTAADTSNENIDFSAYDLVVVFHAGVGRDIALPYDPTPQDIPSLFLNETFLKQALGSSFDGIPVNGGKHRIKAGILLPETQNQEGHAIALTGFFVSNIGSYLGLYDLFSPSTQRSGIGRFGLMDAGLLNLNGLVPAPPSAFSRYLLGWDKPVDLLEPASNIPVGHLYGSSENLAPTLYRVYLNSDEYYLIECRGDPAVNMDSLYEEMAYTRDELPTYMEFLKTYFADQIEIGKSGVLVKVPNYDWGLPGSGILIWHIDERVIASKGPSNRINDDPAWRAVDLEEADGSQDIGQYYTLLDAGYGKDLGWFADFWFSNRPDYLKSFELYTNEFSSTSRPSTVSNWNHAYSHIRLYDFSSKQQDVMTFSFNREMVEPGFPLSFGVKEKVTDFLFLKHLGDNYLYFGLQNGDLKVLVVDFDNNDIGVWPVTSGEGKPLRWLNAMDIDNDGSFNWIISTFDSLITFNPVMFPISGVPSTSLKWEAPARIVTQPVVVDDRLFVVCANDSLYQFKASNTQLELLNRTNGYGMVHDLVVGANGNIPSAAATEHSAMGVHADQQSFTVYASSKNGQTNFTVFEDGGQSEFSLQVIPVGDFALADMDGNGTLDIVFNSVNEIWTINTNGTKVTNFSIRPVFERPDSLIGTPLIADLNGDKQAEIVVATKSGGLLAVDVQGRLLNDFPLSIGGRLTRSPAIVQWDDDQPFELLAVTENGVMEVWELSTSPDAALIWPMAQLNPQANPFLVLQPDQLVKKPSDLLPANRVYNYPNPNEGDFTTIRFYVSSDAQVDVRIFDLAGSLVKTFSVQARGKADSEIVWNVADVAAGVYLCQVEARTGDKTERRLFKIMVVH